MCVEAVARGILTDGEFKQATWDYVQDTDTATSTWGDIGDWDTSGVKDFSYAFSRLRPQGDSTSTTRQSNPKAETFVGTGISKWITSSVTNMQKTFYKAAAFNGDISAWITSSITNMGFTFSGASSFAGTGVDLWNVNKVTIMSNIFDGTTALTSCNKRKIADAWKSIQSFVGTSYDNYDWADDKCPVVRFE